MSDERVISIELIYYDNPEARTNPSEAFPLDLDKIEILEVLDDSLIESFVDVFYVSVSGGQHNGVLFSHDGIGVRFIHEDGSFEIVTLTTVELETMARVTEEKRFFMGLYYSDGNVISTDDMSGRIFVSDSVGRFSDWFYNLLDEYFTMRQS